MPKVLVTGSSGFIGSRLVEVLDNLDYEVLEFPRTQVCISDNHGWDELDGVDIVVHLAALNHVPESWEKPIEYVDVNVVGTLRALEFCRKHGAKLIYFSSYMYGQSGGLPIKEDAPLSVLNPYALSKKIAEESCEFYATNFNTSVIILRPFNVYGPRQKSHFIIPLIVNKVLALESPILLNSLTPRRDFIYVDDVVSLTIRAFGLLGYHIFNVGAGKSYSIEEIVNRVQDMLGTKQDLAARGLDRINEITDSVADISKAKELLGWVPMWDINRGLYEVIKYHQ